MLSRKPSVNHVVLKRQLMYGGFHILSFPTVCTVMILTSCLANVVDLDQKEQSDQGLHHHSICIFWMHYCRAIWAAAQQNQQNEMCTH